MKNILLFTTLLFFVSFFTNAQKSTKKIARATKIKVLKIAFLTKELDLTSSEAEKFWPVYNLYDEKLHQLERVEKQKLRAQIKNANGIDNISENEAKSIIHEIASIDEKVHKIKVAFDKELAKVLSFKKQLKLKIAEKEFVRKLMKKYRRKKPGLKRGQ